MSVVDPWLLAKYDQAVPRYTSYPTAPFWEPLDEKIYLEKLKQIDAANAPLSLYFHIPFCHTMCLFCGCSVVLNRRPENEERYVAYLMREIELVCCHFQKKRNVWQLHFGGGTPTKLSIPLFEKLFEKISNSFDIDFSKEVAIEIDPRTVYADGGEKLKCLKNIGFNRVSFGVQDTDPAVQEAIKRRQSFEVTKWTYHFARNLGFQTINLDLIYGLPFQSEASFKKTLHEIIELRPDRIALFSYAKVPWLKPHQRAIKEKDLPSTEEKFKIYIFAREMLISTGYEAIGMDHFALETDEIAKSFRSRTLQRNFQGYSLAYTENSLGFGVTAIGFARGCYFQNMKKLNEYYYAIENGRLPICLGKVLTQDDRTRKWVIHTLMCAFEVDKKDFEERFFQTFDTYFSDEKEYLEHLVREGLIRLTPEKVIVTPTGELFVRIIAAVFDTYLAKKKQNVQFSSSI